MLCKALTSLIYLAVLARVCLDLSKNQHEMTSSNRRTLKLIAQSILRRLKECNKKNYLTIMQICMP